MSAQGEAGKPRKSNISTSTGETSQHNRTQAVKLTDIINEGLKKPVTPQLPVPKRRYFVVQNEDGRIKSRGDSLSDKQHHYQFASNFKPQEDDCGVEDRPLMISSSHFEYERQGDRAGPVAHYDSVRKPVHKDKYVDTSVWSKLLHPEQRHIKRCRPSENRFDAPIGNTRSMNQDEAENGQLQAVEEGIGPLHITEDRPVRAEMVDEHLGNVELVVKRRLDSVGTNYLKEIERQLEVIEQGQLANLHLDPADEDPMLAAVIPRPDGANSGEAVFHRGEPVRSSAGGVMGGTASKSRPRTSSDNAGHLSPDDVTMPSRRGFGRTPVRRHSKSPTASPVARRIPPSDNILKTGNSNNVSLEVCF
jgi:hypothetical protein